MFNTVQGFIDRVKKTSRSNTCDAYDLINKQTTEVIALFQSEDNVLQLAQEADPSVVYLLISKDYEYFAQLFKSSTKLNQLASVCGDVVDLLINAHAELIMPLYKTSEDVIRLAMASESCAVSFVFLCSDDRYKAMHEIFKQATIDDVLCEYANKTNKSNLLNLFMLFIPDQNKTVESLGKLNEILKNKPTTNNNLPKLFDLPTSKSSSMMRDSMGWVQRRLFGSN